MSDRKSFYRSPHYNARLSPNRRPHHNHVLATVSTRVLTIQLRSPELRPYATNASQVGDCESSECLGHDLAVRSHPDYLTPRDTVRHV